MSKQAGRTIQLYLDDGTPNGLMVASLKGWTGSILVARNDTLPKMLKRPEAERTGVYILFGPDPSGKREHSAYIGEAEEIAVRLPKSAKDQPDWEIVAVVTTSDESLTKSHVRSLEARLIELTRKANRTTLSNSQQPPSEKRYLPEADIADMEYFLSNLEIVLPVVGINLLKSATPPSKPASKSVIFEINHSKGAHALAVDSNGEFIVLKGSTALKDTNYASNSYKPLRDALIEAKKLVSTNSGHNLEFAEDIAFKSPSAAAAVVLDRNSNGRVEWKVKDKGVTYHDWQQQLSVPVGTTA
jgi:hypothetical protein